MVTRNGPYVVCKTGVGISSMFVLVSCIGYTMNVVASRTPCVLALVSTVLHAWA